MKLVARVSKQVKADIKIWVSLFEKSSRCKARVVWIQAAGMGPVKTDIDPENWEAAQEEAFKLGEEMLNTFLERVEAENQVGRTLEKEIEALPMPFLFEGRPIRIRYQRSTSGNRAYCYPGGLGRIELPRDRSKWREIFLRAYQSILDGRLIGKREGEERLGEVARVFVAQQAQYEGYNDKSLSERCGLDFIHLCFLRRYLQPLKGGGIGVFPYLTCISDGTVRAIGEGFALPCERRYPGNEGRLWQIGWAPVGGYAVHKVWTKVNLEGEEISQFLGNVNDVPLVRRLWEEDEEKVFALYDVRVATGSLQRYHQVLPLIVLQRENGKEEWYQNVSYELLGIGSFASIRLTLPTGESLKAFYHVCDEVTEPYGVPVMQEYIHRGGTWVGGSAGAGGGFWTY